MQERLTLSVGQATHAGIKSCNQDSIGVFIPPAPVLSTKGAVVAIADGISSSDVSKIASDTAITGFIADYYCTSDAWSVKTAALKVLKATNYWLYAQSQDSPHRHNLDKGYVCTFSAAVFKSNTAHLFHCGDSRIFRLAGGSLEQLTKDHRRRVDEQCSFLTHALGIHQSLDIDYQTLPLIQGDIFVFTTDGVHDFLSNKEIAAFITASTVPANQQPDSLFADIANNLVEMALAAGSDDNLSIQIVRIDSLPECGYAEIQDQAMLLPLPPMLQPKQVFDGYEILRDIYISSRSHVFLAKQQATEQLVVLKTPSTELRDDASYRESLLMEDWIANRINNVHVLKAVKPIQARNYLYSVTEYIDGKHLAQWLNDNPKPDLDVVRDIVKQIAKGLQALHRQEMVHQDLRPNNIMIDTAGTVKIIDFGAIRVAGIAETGNGTTDILGTAQYTAPEYFVGELGSNRADIFSLAVITYQLLTGRLPYGNEVAKSHSRKAQQRLRYISACGNDNNVPHWVDFALNKALAINPAHRYAEVGEFIHDLNHPSPQGLLRQKMPIMERDPQVFWQTFCLLLTVLLIFAVLN
ncbi:MAG: bifunctional protein-serine/threonine kinase/phosphatase [Moritella sp.]|uniref:bifunctional protein-serine/threonine kinase/phosphatase n=1 Tax=Moritella sp. TaxID=78556 RepID=UPI0029ADDA9D|nr:bifunctional protein-serine/threonine kinase/phosphatase [Moritella sp.]MDX2322172.1 bifunctional protein-serine/threonine kinase/phosphatase [Moritella sp.]